MLSNLSKAGQQESYEMLKTRTDIQYMKAVEFKEFTGFTANLLKWLQLTRCERLKSMKMTNCRP